MALPIPWLLYSLMMPWVLARKASRPTFQTSLPVSRMVVMSPRVAGAKRSSPGPVNVDEASSPPATSFLRENLTLPFRVTVGDMAIITPGELC